MVRHTSWITLLSVILALAPRAWACTASLVCGKLKSSCSCTVSSTNGCSCTETTSTDSCCETFSDGSSNCTTSACTDPPLASVAASEFAPRPPSRPAQAQEPAAPDQTESLVGPGVGLADVRASLNGGRLSGISYTLTNNGDQPITAFEVVLAFYSGSTQITTVTSWEDFRVGDGPGVAADGEVQQKVPTVIDGAENLTGWRAVLSFVELGDGTRLGVEAGGLISSARAAAARLCEKVLATYREYGDSPQLAKVLQSPGRLGSEGAESPGLESRILRIYRDEGPAAAMAETRRVLGRLSDTGSPRARN